MRNRISLIQQHNRIVPNKNVVIEPLPAFFIDFISSSITVITLAVDSTHALGVSES